jgi:hypothetical protein
MSARAGAKVIKLPRLHTEIERRAGPCEVLRFVPKHRGPSVDHDTVRELETLLYHARLGRITGIAWAASIPPNLVKRGDEMACDFAGAAARDAALGCQLAVELQYKGRAMARGEDVEH